MNIETQADAKVKTGHSFMFQKYLLSIKCLGKFDKILVTCTILNRS